MEIRDVIRAKDHEAIGMEFWGGVPHVASQRDDAQQAPIPPSCCMAARRSQHPINDQPQPNPCASHLHECLTLDCAIINSCPLPGWPSGCCQHPVPSHHACLQSMLGQTDDRQRLQQAQPGQSVVPPNGDDAYFDCDSALARPLHPSTRSPTCAGLRDVS